MEARSVKGSARLLHGDYRETMRDVVCDALITDAPYSARTHGGRDGAATVGGQRGGPGDPRYETWGSGNTLAPGTLYERRAISYDGWTPEDVRECVEFFAPRTLGWMVTITDHVLAPAWSEAMAASGRYVFAPLPWFAPGSRVRLAGDGPSSWTCWIVVGRPREGCDRNGRPFSKWGTLPGGYNIPSERGGHIGGKPLALMDALVRDYTRPGDTVGDPCAGFATTLIAARNAGRIGIGSEVDAETYHKGLERIRGRVPRVKPDKGVDELPLFAP